MFDTLFGAEMPLAVRFFLAFLIVLGLIGVTAWAVRRFGAGRLGGAGARGRQPRLAVIDYASVDGRRRLILVRRDNVEHLLMIGGPTDVVVEPNIVRAVAAPRDLGSRPAAGIEALPRAIPLPENGNGHGGGSWPLQPEPAGVGRPAPRLEPSPEELPRSFQPAAEPPPRPQRDTLAALADELTTRPPAPSRNRPAAARPLPDESLMEPKVELRQEPRTGTADRAAAQARRTACPADCRGTAAGAAGFSRAGDGSRSHPRSKPGRHGATPGSGVAQTDRRNPPAGRDGTAGAGAGRRRTAPDAAPRRGQSRTPRSQAEPGQDHAL